MMADETQATEAVRTAARAARAAAPSLAGASDGAIDAALGAMASALQDAAPAVLAANADDMRAAEEGGLPAGVRDRLRAYDSTPEWPESGTLQSGPVGPGSAWRKSR